MVALMSIDLTRLRVFRAVLASGTVQAAAQHLGYSPSAVSQQLAALQRETGLTLLEKSGRGLAPTAAGQVLAQRSDEVMGALSRLETLAADLRDGRTGNVVIATVASVGESWIPKIAHTMREEFPEVVLTVDLNEHPMDASIQPDVDVCTEHPEQAIVPRAGYRRVSIHTEPYVLVVPKTHRFAAEPQVAMSQLQGEPLIDDSLARTTCGLILRTAFQASGITPHYVARTADHHGALAFVGAGVGLFIGPLLALDAAPDSVALVPLCEPVVQRRIVAYVREDSASNAAVRRVIELLREVAKTGSA